MEPFVFLVQERDCFCECLELFIRRRCVAIDNELYRCADLLPNVDTDVFCKFAEAGESCLGAFCLELVYLVSLRSLQAPSGQTFILSPLNMLFVPIGMRGLPLNSIEPMSSCSKEACILHPNE